MQFVERFRPWYGRKVVRGFVVVAILGVATVLVLSDNTEEQIVSETRKTQVTLTTPTEYAGGQSLSLVGNVRAFSEAAITAERAGRVTSVPVTLGDTVFAGQIIASLENAAEQAAVLQAEGVYEAALASAAQSDISVSEAKTNQLNAQKNAVSAFNAAYNTVNGVVRNNIDQFFSNPDGTVPGLRIDGRGFTDTLNRERVAYQSILPTWQGKTQSISAASNLSTELQYAEQVTQQTIDLVDIFLTIFSQQSAGSRYSEAELTAFRTEFTSLRSTLIGVQSSIDTAQAGLESAADMLRKAEVGAVGGATSAADAQVKQALGSLRAAQANLAKTILRSPISGTLNEVSVRTGDFVNNSQQIAEVANNSALEIVTYISDAERNLLAVGDEVLIENDFVGTVTQVAPAVDPTTRKIEVRIATEGTAIQNGDTVRVTKNVASSSVEVITAPLSAVKFQAENGQMFTVVDGVLEVREVVVGDVRGGSVVIESGLATDDFFVVDVRGLQPGTAVEVTE